MMKVMWADIVVIGKETVLVRDAEELPVPAAKKSRLSDIF